MMASADFVNAGVGAGGPSIEQVIRAVTCILDPQSPATDRNAAHQLCEAIKQSPNAPSYGFQLATLEMPLAVRLFGLNVLEDFIRTRLVVTDATDLRDRVWGLLALVVAVRPEERRLMQDKCAMLVAQLAMRIWPQYWPDFFDRLLEFVVVSPDALHGADEAAVFVRTEMGLLMARMIVDEVHPREGAAVTAQQKLIWDDSRRPELQKALALVLPTMMERLYKLIPYCANALNPAQVPAMRKFLETMIESFGSLCLWTPLERQSTIQCILGLLRMASLQNSELTTVSLEVLGLFAARPARPQEAELFSDLFDALLEPLQQLFSSLVVSTGNSNNVDDDGKYDHFKKLTDAVVTLAAMNMGHKKSPCIPRRLDGVLDLMLQLSNFPSLLVTSTVGSFWNAMAKSDKLVAQDAVISRLPSIFLYALLTLAQDRRAERRRSPYNTEDFAPGDGEADGDFEALFATHQNRTMDLLRQIASHYPDRFAAYCANAVGSFVAERATVGGLSADLGAVGLRQWDALMHATDAVLKSCHSRLVALSAAAGGAEDQQASQQKSALVDQISLLADYLTNDEALIKMHPETIYLWFVSLRMLTPCLGTIGSPHFSPLMQRLFELTLSYAVEPASLQFAIRARASTTILKVCQTHPSLFVPAVDYLVGLFKELISRSVDGTITSTGGREKSREERLLTEMLLMTAGCVEGSYHRTELVKLVLTPLADQMSSISGTLTGLSVFLQFCGLGHLLGASNKTETEADAFRKNLSGIVSLLYVVLGNLKKLAIAGDVRSIINQFVPPTLSFLSHLIQLVHSAYDRRQYPTGASWEMHFGEDVMATDVPAMEKALDGDLMAESVDSVGGKSMRGWLYMLRVSLYMNYGLLFSLAPNAMYNGPADQLIAPLNGCETFTLSQWMLLIRHLVSPLLLNVASSEPIVKARRDVLHKLLLLLIEKFGLVQLEAAWQAHRAATERQGGGENASVGVERETAQEALLGTATGALLSLLFDTLLPVTERDKRSDPVLDLLQLRSRNATFSDCSNSPLALFVMRADALVTGRILALLVAMLRWKPSLGLGKILAILLRWLPHLMLYNSTHHEIIFASMMPHLLGFLSVTALADHHAQITACLTELYKWQLYYNYEIIDKQVTSLSLPNAPSIIHELRQYFMLTTPVPNAKAQRGYMKNTLVKAIQQQALSAVGVTSTVPRLPDRLVVLKKLKAEAAAEDVNLDLASFFDHQ